MWRDKAGIRASHRRVMGSGLLLSLHWVVQAFLIIGCLVSAIDPLIKLVAILALLLVLFLHTRRYFRFAGQQRRLRRQMGENMVVVETPKAKRGDPNWAGSDPNKPKRDWIFDDDEKPKRDQA